MTIVEQIGWVLLHFVWQGTVIALALGVVLALTREAQARLRYICSCGALVLMLGATVATAMLIRPAGGVAMQVGAAAVPESSPFRPGPWADPRAACSAGSPALVNPTTALGETDAKRGSLRQAMVDRAIPWLVMTWIAGVLLLTFRLLGGWWSTRTLRTVGVSPVPDWCVAQLSGLSERMGVARPVAIVSSVRIAVPIILGHLKPVVLLPAAALSGLTATQVEAILAHELAHVRRHDYLVNLAQTVIETLLFYHPAVWWVSRQVRETREHCCDDLAVGVCRSRREYVNALLDLEELRGSMPALALGATGGSLLARGRRLLAPSQARTASPRLAASVIALISVAAAVVSASFSSAAVPPWSEPGPTPPVAMTPGPSPDVQGSDATPVTTAPDTAAPLSNRWAWAESAARAAGRRTYWIGYTVSPVKTLPPFIYSDRSSTVMGDKISFQGGLFSTDATDLRFPGRPLAVTPAGSREVKLLFELSAAGREPRLTAVHTSTLSLPVDTKGQPVFWLGHADAAQSLDRVDRFYQAASDPELKHDLIAAAGVHDASAAVVAWLERRVASGDPEEIRGNAAEWIARHPIPASITVLDKTARTDRSSQVRQEAAEALGDVALPEATPVLIALARSLTDRAARSEAVEALGSRPERAASEALAAIARNDADLDIQREAVETLGDFEDKRGVEALMELARTHPSVEVRREAVETLADAMPEAEAAQFLKSLALAEPSEDVRSEALETLADLHDGRGIAALIDLAREHPSAAARREALERLLESDHPDARALFERAVKK